MKMSPVTWIAYILVIVGGLNWGLWGIGHWNLVKIILGGVPFLENLVYYLVGLSALYLIFFGPHRKKA